MRLRKPVVTASALVMLLSAAACGGSGGDEATAATGTCTTERIGGSVTQGTLLSPRGLDPVGQPGAAGSGGTEVQALFDTLITYNAETQAYEPQVAQSLDSNADHSVWTMKLRDGVTFGNGDALTADDVKRSIERHQSPSNTQSISWRSVDHRLHGRCRPADDSLHTRRSISQLPSRSGH